jgi:DNA-binding LacI/PurR family transcriptional regulator
LKRTTIADIARAAGVSKGVVSYALNGKPGVSAATRERILAIATQVGFRANSSARVLAGAASKVVGLALQRPAQTLEVEPFFMELVSGLEAELSASNFALLLHMVPDEPAEVELYRQWWNDRRVDGVIICDLYNNDARVRFIQDLGLPAVIIGPPGSSISLSSIWSDDEASIWETVEYLVALGHRRIARVAGIAELAHTRVRTVAFERACAASHLTGFPATFTDYTGEAGARATRDLLSSPEPPTAIVYDNDIMAVAGLVTAQEMGRIVPADLAIVAWDDSPICRLVHPPLTALTRDIGDYGSQAARLLLSTIAQGPGKSVIVDPAHLTPRGTTGPVTK